jgi:glucokinase
MYLGIDVGGTSIKAGVFDDEFNILRKYHTPYLENALSDNFPNFLMEQLFKIWNDANSEFSVISAIGCGVPGVVSNDGIIAVAPNMKGIINFPIKKLFREIITLPLAVDNDANAAALAELKLGNGKSIEHFIYITLGTGIGGAIISGGEIFRGSSGGAGEIGHTIIDYNNSDYDKRPYRIGVIEVFSGREGILRLANEILENNINSNLSKIENFDVSDIAKLAETGDEVSIEILKITGERIGVALANSANILDIPTFIIGGGISQSKILLNEIESTLKLRSIPSVAERAKVIPAKFVQDTGIVGAAVLAKFYAT